MIHKHEAKNVVKSTDYDNSELMVLPVVDVLVLTLMQDDPADSRYRDLKIGILLEERNINEWVLPNKIIQKHESVEEAADSLIMNISHSSNQLTPFRYFSEPDRESPEGSRVLSFSFIQLHEMMVENGSSAPGYCWFDIAELPTLSNEFNQKSILDAALTFIKEKKGDDYINYILNLMPEEFRSRLLQQTWSLFKEEKSDNYAVFRYLRNAEKNKTISMREQPEEIEKKKGRPAKIYKKIKG